MTGPNLDPNCLTLSEHLFPRYFGRENLDDTKRTCRITPHKHIDSVHWQGSYASGKFKFFQGQGIVREFYVVSGKNECFLKCQGILKFPVCIK